MLRGFVVGLFWGVILIGGILTAASVRSPLPSTVKPQTKALTPQNAENVVTSAIDVETPDAQDQAIEGAPSSPVSAVTGEATPAPDFTDSAPKPAPATIETALSAPQYDAGQSVELKAETPVAASAQPARPDVAEPEAKPMIATLPAPTVDPVAKGEQGAPVVVEETPLVSEPRPIEVAEDLTPRAEAEEIVVEEQEAGASMIKPAGDLKDSFPQLQSSRLPAVGDETAEAPATETLDDAAPRPVEFNAESFENTENKPLMSIVLVDTTEHSFDMEALESFPFPLSIAVSTLDPQVAEKTADYRQRGFEVLAMVDVPAEAAAADVEQAMQAHLSVADSFVGVMEGLSDGLQGSKVVSDQVAQVVRGSGHGLLMFSNGLNTAQKLAAKAGVPSNSVFRDFDNAGQTAVVMRRFLDNAAFKAGQQDGVVMVGRLRDETISALLLWGLQDRARTVALAPISATFETLN